MQLFCPAPVHTKGTPLSVKDRCVRYGRSKCNAKDRRDVRSIVRSLW